MEKSLQHHGILGQKWGVRRSRAQLSRLSGKSTSDSDAEGSSKAGASKIKGTSSKKSSAYRLSDVPDDVLKSRIQRLQMEENYSSLVAKQKERNTSGVQRAITSAAKTLGNQVMNQAMSKLANHIVNGKDKPADYDFSDLTKVTNERLSAAVKRLKSEKAYQKLRAEMTATPAKSDAKSKIQSSTTSTAPKAESTSSYSKFPTTSQWTYKSDSPKFNSTSARSVSRLNSSLDASRNKTLSNIAKQQAAAMRIIRDIG